MRIAKTLAIFSLPLSPHTATLSRRWSLLAASVAATGALLQPPPAAHATDLTFAIGAETEYDTNALRTSSNEEDDVLFRFRPEVRVHEDRGQDVNYSLSYVLPFEFAVDHSNELDDVDHHVLGNISYHPNDRLELFVSDDFRYLRSALQQVAVEDVVFGTGTLLVNQQRDRVTLNDGEAGLRYRFTPRLSGEAKVTQQSFASARPDRADNWLIEGEGNLSYLLTPQHSLGFGFRYTHQDFQDRDNIPGSLVDSYNVFAQWIFRFSETLQFEIDAGPSFIDSRQNDPASTQTTAAIPYLIVPDGFVLDGSGLVNPDGTAATGTANPGSIVVSQLASCPTIVGSGTQVIAGNVCTIPGPGAGTPTTAGVFLDGLNNPTAVTAATNTNVVNDPFARGESDTSLNIFGSAVLRKDWTENLHTALRYQRTQADASGLGGAVVADYVSLSNTWDFAERWQLAVRGDWVDRRSIANNGVSQYLQAGDASGLDAAFTGTTPAGAVGLVTIQGGNTNRIATTRFGVAGRLTHGFTRNTSGWVQLTYNDQSSSSNTLGNPSDFQDFLATVGIRYVFEPIKLW